MLKISKPATTKAAQFADFLARAMGKRDFPLGIKAGQLELLPAVGGGCSVTVNGTEALSIDANGRKFLGADVIRPLICSVIFPDTVHLGVAGITHLSGGTVRVNQGDIYDDTQLNIPADGVLTMTMMSSGKTTSVAGQGVMYIERNGVHTGILMHFNSSDAYQGCSQTATIDVTEGDYVKFVSEDIGGSAFTVHRPSFHAVFTPEGY